VADRFLLSLCAGITTDNKGLEFELEVVMALELFLSIWTEFNLPKSKAREITSYSYYAYLPGSKVMRPALQ
jgi:hypothetical protein